MQDYIILSIASILLTSLLWYFLYSSKNKQLEANISELNKLKNEQDILVNEKAGKKIIEIQNQKTSETEQSFLDLKKKTEEAYHKGFSDGEERSKKEIEELKNKYWVKVEDFVHQEETKRGIIDVFSSSKEKYVAGVTLTLMIDNIPSAFHYDSVKKTIEKSETIVKKEAFELAANLALSLSPQGRAANLAVKHISSFAKNS